MIRAELKAFGVASVDMSTALSAAKMAAWTFRAADRSLAVTPEFNRLLGLPPGARVELDALVARLAPEDVKRVRACVDAALCSDGFVRIDLRLRRFDDEMRWFLLRAKAEMGDGGLSISGMLIDLTERKLEELANAHLAAVVTSTPYAVVCIDRAGAVTVWNEGAERIFGQSAADMMGQPLASIVPGDKLVELADVWREAFAGRTARVDTERLRNDGRRVPVTVTAAPIFAPDREVVGLSAIYEDRTEAQASQERLDLLIRELHHRVRNTLATVQGIAGVTATACGSIQEFRDAFTRRIAALAATHFRLTEANQQALCISELIEQELGPFVSEERVRAAGPRVELDSHVAPTLAMAIHELATNAAKHGALRGAQGWVEIKWAVQGERVSLSWAEHGVAVAAAPTRRGFGATLLDHVVPAQFGAPVARSFAEDGVRVRIDLPLSQDQGPARTLGLSKTL